MDGYPKESRLEKYIKDFVYKKLADRIELTLKNAIILQHVTKKGSIVLATLWANVLQHPKNFPKDQFPYEEVRDATNGGTKLIGKAEDVTFTVYMANGTLKMEGTYIYEWFTRRFQELLENADKDFTDNYTYVASSSDSYPAPETFVREPHGDIDTETEKYMSLRNVGYSELPPMHSLIPEGPEDYIQGRGNLNVDSTLFSESELPAELSTLASGGAMRDGFVYVYKLWKSLLNKWFSTPGTDVYMASPFVDADRLADLIQIYLRHRAKGKLHTFYTRQRCGSEGQISTVEIQRDAAKKFTSRQKVLVEYEIYRRMVYPVNRISGKFIAAVHGEEVEIMVTSANFSGEHFVRENQETVFYSTMSKERFETEYLGSIASPVVATI